MYVIWLFNFLGFSRIAVKIKTIDLGNSNILILSVRNTIFFGTVFCFDFKSKYMLLVMRVGMFLFVGLKSLGTLMKCV